MNPLREAIQTQLETLDDTELQNLLTHLQQLKPMADNYHPETDPILNGEFDYLDELDLPFDLSLRVKEFVYAN